MRVRNDGEGSSSSCSKTAASRCTADAISTTAPAGAEAGDLWWDSDDGQLYIYYSDPSGDNYWVSATPIATNQAAQIAALQAQVNSLLARVTTLES